MSTEIEKNKKDIDSQLLQTVVVTGYGASSETNSGTKPGRDKNFKLLQKECLRIAKRLSELQIPEWQENEVEFTFEVVFHLR